ncbi:leucyl aminopeptidase [Candidatus Pelagibacter communis]|uniref:leucyl aminopeptidase n=1 Tax=Pelagibacter ubique TaxID=198252 RepID=UPI00094D4147|nr:leucyl aminopeptidase [Candidatus Pelagibacter ubique]
MALNLSYISKKTTGDLVIFYTEKYKLIELNYYFKNQEIDYINQIINSKSIRANNKKLSIFNLNPSQRIVIVPVKPGQTSFENEKSGAKFYEFLKSNFVFSISILDKNAKFFSKKNKFFLNEFLHGLQLKSYEFNKYKTKDESKNININIPIKMKSNIKKINSKFNAILNGTNLTKDLVSEPGNILHPDEYAKRIMQLRKFGLKVTILNKNKLKKMGMNALLGVGQGSIRGSYLVIIEWRGSSKNNKPLAFVGKGVCFDTGGISLKPAKFMEDMTYDMAGSAVVVGLMKNLALRKAKINAVGVVGLVENMPDGNAQRPGDIVRSYSGKTIEVLNTDAEGRLVLADALTYTEEKFKPKFIIDLATLTGAIIVALGSEYAGLFSNDDKLSNQIYNSGIKVDEKVWRMPLNKSYDKLINSKKADMQNINYVGGAGSTTAAQFLQRFIINKTPWAHLDIAGMAFSKYGGALNSGGATGFGVRLLNQLIEDNYE